MPYNDDEGRWLQELSWWLMERGMSVQLAWSSTMNDGQFAGKQPEDWSIPTFAARNGVRRIPPLSLFCGL